MSIIPLIHDPHAMNGEHHRPLITPHKPAAFQKRTGATSRRVENYRSFLEEELKKNTLNE
jgi:hypothetical protein